MAPKERLADLEATFCPPQREALLRAARTIIACYREVAPPLAQAHGIVYPAALEQIICARLDALETPDALEALDALGDPSRAGAPSD